VRRLDRRASYGSSARLPGRRENSERGRLLLSSFAVFLPVEASQKSIGWPLFGGFLFYANAAPLPSCVVVRGWSGSCAFLGVFGDRSAVL